MSFLKTLYSRKKLSDGRVKQKIFGISFKYRPKDGPYPPVKHPKLGVSYSVWDGEELLEGAIRSIRPAVDYVNVVWQRLSWHGKECHPDLEKLLIDLKNKGLIDEIIFFDCDPSINSNVNECAKRNLGLEAARQAECTHFMTLDTDEYWDLEQFKIAKQYVYDKNISHSACPHVLYRTPTVRHLDYADFFISFIYRIDHGEKFVNGCFADELPWRMDPTREIPITKRSRVCFLHNILCHHYSYVRKDLIKKIKNTAANHNAEEEQKYLNEWTCSDTQMQERLNSGYYVPVPNRFHINIGEEK